MDSSLFPFASCAFQAPCWAPNKRLLHSGPIPYSHPPTARSQVPLHLLPTHKTQLPKRVLGGEGAKNHSPPSQGVKMVLTLTSPHHKLPLSPPSPKGSIQSVCRDIQCGGLNKELVSGSGTPPFIFPTPSPPRGPRSKPGPETEPELEGEGWRRNTVPLWMEARPGMRLTLKSGSIRRIGGCGVYKNLGGLGLDERDDLLGEGQVLLG